MDLGEPEKEELLATGKEEGREGRHSFRPCLLFLVSLSTKEPRVGEVEGVSALEFKDFSSSLTSLK